MIFPEQRFRLKDGRTCALRAAQPEDAEAMLDYLRTTAGETPYLLREPDEVDMTVEQEADFLRTMRDNPRALMLLVLVDGDCAGCCSVMPVGTRSRVLHRCGFAIALYEKYCGQGLGHTLLQTAMDAAKAAGYEQGELSVVCGNDRALRLYTHLGFERCGTLPHTLKYRDGRYADEILMVKTL